MSLIRWIATLSLLSAVLPAEVSGVLTDPSGAPVPGVEVGVAGQAASAVTDAQGVFTLDLPPGTYRLEILDHRVAAVFGEGVAATIRLPFFSERVIVEPPAAEAFDVPSAEMEAGSGNSLTDKLAAQPGLALNGLGGATQSVSIGGFAKHRVRMEMNGYRIEGDRRAGADYATLIPALVDGAEIFRGGTGLTHGSEAIGGVVDVNLPRPGDAARPVEVAAGYGENNYQGFGLARVTGPGAVLALGYEKAGDYEDGDGNLLPGHFTRYNLSATLKREGGESQQYYDLFYSRGEDLGKPQDTARPTEYPEATVAILGTRGFSGAWRYQAGVVYQDLVTATKDEESDLSSWNLHAKTYHDRGGLTLGVELYTRQDVNADVTLRTGPEKPLDGAYRWEVSPLAAYERALGGAWTLEAGLRWNQVWASDGREESRSDGLPTTLARFRWAQGPFTFGASVFNSYRFPTMEELYYSGLSARGLVNGNPDLDPERGVGGSVEGAWTPGAVEVSLAYQVQEVDDYIERYKESGEYWFRNIAGARVQDLTAVLRGADLRFSVSWSEGEDTDTGAAVDDIPALRAAAFWRRAFGAFEPWALLQWADDKTDPGPNEVERDSYATIGLGCRWSHASGFSLEVKADNLLDEAYYAVADNQAVMAMGRSVVVRARMAF
jgi:outer membrane cobalamin receptor